MARHDTIAHMVAGGLGIRAPGCPVCDGTAEADQCDYIFSGKTVVARCGRPLGHVTGHGDWRDPATGERVTK
jgi:hypothetical protein